MAAPTFAGVTTSGKTDAGGAWSYSLTNPPQVGDVLVLQILQDGSTSGAVAITGVPTSGRIESLAGVEDVWTAIGEFAGGSLQQYLWIARAKTTASAWGASGTNSTSEDLYIRGYVFRNVNTGTTLADVIEQNGTTTPATTSGTSNTIADAGVITTGVDRLACNFVAVNDDNALDAFTGMTGGTWAEAVAEYASSTGTDGAIGLQIATMAAAGTIDGGTDTMAVSDGWGVVGFALIGTTVVVTFVPRHPTHDHGSVTIF